MFCRTWYPVACPKYYNPVTSLLLSKDGKKNWTGMRTVGEIRHERGLKVDQNKDSLYKVTKTFFAVLGGGCCLGSMWSVRG